MISKGTRLAINRLLPQAGYKQYPEETLNIWEGHANSIQNQQILHVCISLFILAHTT